MSSPRVVFERFEIEGEIFRVVSADFKKSPSDIPK